jgi:hypothetical protein
MQVVVGKTAARQCRQNTGKANASGALHPPSCGRRCIPFLLLREAKGSEVGAHPRSVFRQSVEARRGLSAKVPFVHIEKATIVRHLRELGRHEDAIRADRELPDRIHTAQDVELFERFGLDPTGFEGETFRDRPPKEI